jgi:hypothetical protein
LIYKAVARSLRENILARCDLVLRASTRWTKRPITVCTAPKCERDRHGVDIAPIPPCRLITVPVKRARWPIAMIEAEIETGTEAGTGRPGLGHEGTTVRGAPGPVAGAGLPFLAVGYGIFWLVKRRRRKTD